MCLVQLKLLGSLQFFILFCPIPIQSEAIVLLLFQNQGTYSYINTYTSTYSVNAVTIQKSNNKSKTEKIKRSELKAAAHTAAVVCMK